jgi:hypothetical protein
MSIQEAPHSISEAVARELQGEAILWASSPNRWAYSSKYWKTAAFGIPFFAFSIFWTYMALRIPAKAASPVAVFFPLWGLMFVFFGAAMLLAPLIGAWNAGNVYYVVTQRRAVIFEKAFQLKICSFTPTSIAGYERISSGGSGGSIIFERSVERRSRGSKVTETGFIGLRDYAEAEQALNKLIAFNPRS